LLDRKFVEFSLQKTSILFIFNEKWKNEKFPPFFCCQGMGKIVGKENLAAKVAIIDTKVLVKFGYK
jgi:hypothetical protein